MRCGSRVYADGVTSNRHAIFLRDFSSLARVVRMHTLRQVSALGERSQCSGWSRYLVDLTC
jgi:hypothetical protein